MGRKDWAPGASGAFAEDGDELPSRSGLSNLRPVNAPRGERFELPSQRRHQRHDDHADSSLEAAEYVDPYAYGSDGDGVHLHYAPYDTDLTYGEASFDGDVDSRGAESLTERYYYHYDDDHYDDDLVAEDGHEGYHHDRGYPDYADPEYADPEYADDVDGLAYPVIDDPYLDGADLYDREFADGDVQPRAPGARGRRGGHRPRHRRGISADAADTDVEWWNRSYGMVPMWVWIGLAGLLVLVLLVSTASGNSDGEAGGAGGSVASPASPLGLDPLLGTNASGGASSVESIASPPQPATPVSPTDAQASPTKGVAGDGTTTQDRYGSGSPSPVQLNAVAAAATTSAPTATAAKVTTTTAKVSTTTVKATTTTAKVTTTTAKATTTTAKATTTTAKVTTTTQAATTTTTTSAPGRGWDCDMASADPAYPTICIPAGVSDLDCPDIPYTDFPVPGADPHGFDRPPRNNVGCES